MEIGVGSRTINKDGEIITIISVEKDMENCLAYNVITDRHINIFANGILTSCAMSNIFKIKDMKYLEQNEECLTLDDLEGIPEKYINGLRLTSLPCSFEGTRKKSIKFIKQYVNKLIDSEDKEQEKH